MLIDNIYISDNISSDMHNNYMNAVWTVHMYRHYTVGNIPVGEKERVKLGHIDISVEERERG